ncbi:MAG: DUF4129 domain-containing protein [Thermoplasmata archaeon]
MKKLRVFIFSIILVWASISLAFIVQDIYSGPERSIKTSPQSVNVTTMEFYNSGPVNSLLILQAILIIWAISSLFAFIFYFKKSLYIIFRITMSMLGVFIVMGFTYLIAWFIVFNYPTKSQIPIFSPQYLSGSIPFIIPLIILFLILLYIGSRHIPTKVRKENVNISDSIGRMIKELRFSDDIRGAIMKVYYDLSNTLQKHGIIEEEYLTPREFENISLKKIGIDSRPFETIVKLFEEARYSNHPLNEDHRKMAIDALESIKRLLGE